MLSIQETRARLARVPGLAVIEHAPLSRYTRFGIGGPADLYAEASGEAAFVEALRVTRESGRPHVVIGGGTNLIVSDQGFAGIVLRFTGDAIHHQDLQVHAQAGAVLQDLVDYTIAHGLKGIQTMTGIPGSLGAAVYGNAGAYGHSMMERVNRVRFFDGERIRDYNNAACEFHYRESVFKRHKEWTIFSAELHMEAGDPAELQRAAGEILEIRNRKYPPSMKCAGSIFKNLILSELPGSVQGRVPATVVREGKVPSAYFLEQVGAKGIRNGDIHVADYHANLIYNAGNGTARELCEVIGDLKSRVQREFGLELEEEVQYVGFPGGLDSANGARRT